MLVAEFELGMFRLKTTYSDKTFPAEREKLLFQRYKNADGTAFTKAIDQVILQLPQPSMIIGMIDQSLAALKPRQRGADDFREQSYNCEPCKDFGYAWIGDEVQRCLSCDLGAAATDADIARHQASYDRGAPFRQLRKPMASLIKPLPYNPKVRGAV